jgi:hypothetical protein
MQPSEGLVGTFAQSYRVAAFSKPTSDNYAQDFSAALQDLVWESTGLGVEIAALPATIRKMANKHG